ncbi:MAG: hypothetical protein GXO74_12985 [Calditrichaeota bacterium]|nr:hypothetical protein [Calditrichota bacterium]
MKNLYKRLDIFKCKSLGHQQFKNRVSVYHVLRARKCYPQGCIYFQWKCKLFNKGKSCARGYRFVGRKCFGCKHFYDEKINNQPALQLTDEEYSSFLAELDNFEDWVRETDHHKLDIEGEIVSVKPALMKTIQHKSSRLTLSGYFIHFSETFVGRTHWEDHCYAFVYPDQQKRFQFAPGDRFEYRATVQFERGRLVFKKLHRIEFVERSGRPTWTSSQALVTKFTVVSLNKQQNKCLHCRYGVLVDVLDYTRSTRQKRRDLMCLKSVQNPEDCIFHLEDQLIELAEQCGQGAETNIL